jgi:hypothetical protein
LREGSRSDNREGRTRQQAELLKAGKLSDLNTEHLIEEIEAMGRGERRELTQRFEVLSTYLLKWRYQPEFRGRGWQLTIIERRRRIRNSRLSILVRRWIWVIRRNKPTRQAGLQAGMELRAIPSLPRSGGRGFRWCFGPARIALKLQVNLILLS